MFHRKTHGYPKIAAKVWLQDREFLRVLEDADIDIHNKSTFRGRQGFSWFGQACKPRKGRKVWNSEHFLGTYHLYNVGPPR